MKTSVKNIFFALGATAVLASCSENAWNDHLEGFEPGVNYDKALEAEFTMSAADYNAVASNATNKSLAEAAGVANALKAVGTNGMFSAAINAKEYLPAYLASSSAPYFLAADGSKVNVTYLETGVTDPIIAQIAGATAYTVSKNDYISAWGSDVDYINSFAPMTSAEIKLPGILKNALPEAAAGSYAIVSYNESNSNPVFIADSEAEAFTGGTVFLVADGTNAVAPLPYSKGYGYLPAAAVTVADGAVKGDAVNAYNFIPTEGGYYLTDVYGRYLYMKGTYNNFNLSYTVPAEGGVFTVDVAANGQATITNTFNNKWLQYDGGYGNFGAYDSEKGSLPVIYKAPDPKYYLVTEDGHGAGPLPEKNYGYLASVDMTVADGVVTNGDPANAFTFELTEGGYYIKDSSDRYLYQSGTYNSFNFSADLPESGAVWSVATGENGFVTITNNEVGKWIQYDGKYNSWGSYDSEKGSLPKMYNAALTAAPAGKPAKVVASTPASAGKTAVYTFDGNKWAPAEGVAALDAADYAAMGFDNNKLENADVYLPLYLKANMPYAVEGDTEAVVYNGNSCAVLVYDGTQWSVNNDDLQTKTGQFVKENGNWRFVKYVGKAYFNLTTELILDRQYLMVAEGICAVPLATSKNYGYLNPESVNISGNVIEQKNEANAFTFSSIVNVDGKDYRLPDGQFCIIDSNGRYLYMSGTYDSFNVADAPKAADGAIDAGFVWKASCNGETWTISNASNDKWIQYSTSYSSFGCYAAEKGVLPALYMLAAE